MIRVENLGKKYMIGHQKESGSNYVALRDVLADGAKSLVKQFTGQGKGDRRPIQEEFWALKDVSFEVKRGECVGIIGRNGAGKSTLLKILSRITEPTTGRIELHGRVASLLEVGTGFHPELTGRENIYLNGAILGMSRREIKAKFDEIVDFAEVEKFLDTPVKRYSSGMYVRLAFAVAAHLEPEILVVDEVLAVGDAAFQKKCLGKIGEVSEKEGRTVLFVSHNMTAVDQLTAKCLLLEQGQKINFAKSNDTIFQYLNLSHDLKQKNNIYEKKSSDFDKKKEIEFSRIIINYGEQYLRGEITYFVYRKVESVVAVQLSNSHGANILTIRDTDSDPMLFKKNKGIYKAEFSVSLDSLIIDTYYLTFSLANMVDRRYEFLENLLSFEISLSKDPASGWSRSGIIFKESQWKVSLLQDQLACA
ncbi:ABC transporter ATP-binding protein [Synechocystis sp. CS-94]|nr:ABC transporter ATP-binding protein [Synechocystis sp. CS-94]